MLDTVIPIELKEVTNEKREEREDHTTKPTDSLEEEEGKDGSGYTVASSTTCPGTGCITPIPVPVAGACTAAIFTHPSVLDAVVRN